MRKLVIQGIRDDQFAAVCVVVDKLDKIGADEVVKELLAIGVQEATARAIIQSMSGMFRQASSMLIERLNSLIYAE
jgi:hypothetical protein